MTPLRTGTDGFTFRVLEERPSRDTLDTPVLLPAHNRLNPAMTQTHDKILIVDFGSQVTQLIARRVREEGVYSEIVPFQKAAEAFREMKPKG